MKLKVNSIDIVKVGAEGEQDVVAVKMAVPGKDPKASTNIIVRTTYVPLLEHIAHWGKEFEVTFTPVEE